MKNVYFYKYPIGMIGIEEENATIGSIFFGDKVEGKELTDITIAKTPLIEKAANQLAEYFDRKRTDFDLPLALHGTMFQISVWKALQRIPFGETRSYKEIAVMVGNQKASRAVGMANHNNPIAIVIPCHRVIGQNGSLTGYAGGLSIKRYLLDLEMSTIQK